MDLLPVIPIHSKSDDFLKLSQSVLVGFGKGLQNICHTIAHPLDTLVYPVSSLIYDASIISAKHSQGVPDFDLLHSIVNASPKLYEDSVKRMDARIDGIKLGWEAFKASPLEKQVELISQGVTEFYVPGTIIKGIKRLSGLKHVVSTATDAKLFTLDEIRKLPSRKLVFGYTDAHELLLASPANRNVKPTHWLDFSSKYPELAQLKPLLTTGEVLIEAGNILSIENFNGPLNTSDMKAKEVEQAFIDKGFVEASGKCTQRDNPVQSTNLYAIQPEDVKRIIKEVDLSYKNYKKDVSNQINMVKWANNLQEFAIFGSGLSELALMAGGHRRTWTNIGTMCSGLSKMATGITGIMSGGSMMSMASGYVGMAIGMMSIVSSLFGGDESDGLQEMFEALSRQLHEMMTVIMDALKTIHQTIIDGFKHIESLILSSVIPRLIEINMKLDRLESITCLSFRELHSKSLIDLVDTIKKDLVGEVSLSTNERKKYIRKLGTWIDCHSKSPLQTSLLRVGGNDAKSVDVFSNFNDPFDTFSFFLIELSRLTGLSFEIPGLPNIPTFIVAIETYISCILKYGESNEVLIRAREMLDKITKLIETIRNSQAQNLLTRQYHHYRFLVGRQLEKCRTEYNDDTKKLYQYLVPGAEYEKLQNLLDNMELRRVMLMQLNQMCQYPSISYESKMDILNKMNCTVIKNSFDYAKAGDYEKFEKVLNLGLSVNAYNEWGQAIHYVTRYGGIDPKMLHLLFRCPEIEINKPMKYDLGDTYGPNIRPILYTMNVGKFESGILFCAQGHNINEYNIPYGGPMGTFGTTDMGNIYRASDGTWGTCSHGKLTISFTKAMNDAKSKINKTELRKAYQYYKTMEAGLPCDAKVSGECLLLLTCILGDLYPWTYSKLSIDLNQPLEAHGFTYLMLATYCKQWTVVEYLLNQGANPNLETNLCVGYKSAKSLGLENRTTTAVTPQLELVNVFQDISNRIEGVLSVPKQVDVQCDLLLELLLADIDNLSDTQATTVKEYITLIREGQAVGEHLDMIDSIYRLANKKSNFGYNLSGKIERFIQKLIVE